MSYLLDKKTEHESACEKAIREERYPDAIFHSAKAAEFAYALAEQTSGAIRQRYIQNAEGWLEIGERLQKQPLPRRSSSPRPSPPGPRPSSRDPAASSSDDEAAASWQVSEKPSVTLDHIAGMADAKLAIHDMVIFPLKDPDKARALNLRPGGGVLLYGPPGNGKTMLGKAIANELDAAFFYASGAQIRSKWHGESEQKLRALMQAAKNEPVAVLFLDEVDGLLPKRGGNSVVDNRIVTQFLAEVGGFEDSDNVLLILGATNKPWDIDEAVFRTGRFDAKIHVGLPDKDAREGILKHHLATLPLEDGFDFIKWGEQLVGFTGSDIVGIVNDAKRRALRRSIHEDAEPVIKNEDMEGAFTVIPSSVTPAMLKQYEAFGKARFGGS
jgi:transitional endoplasmic reticulum ATPase